MAQPKHLTPQAVGSLFHCTKHMQQRQPYLLVLVLQSMLDDVHQRLEVGQHSTAHEDGNLLHDLDTSVPGLPALLTQTHSLQEGKQGGDAQGTGNHTAGQHASTGRRQEMTSQSLVDVGQALALACSWQW